MSLQIRRLSYALGAEVCGVDISEPLDDRTYQHIHHAFSQYGLLLFRNQPLTRRQHIAFTERFGELDKQEGVVLNRTVEPEIFVNKPEPSDSAPDYVGEYWHTDKAFVLAPAMASLLRAIEIPEVGG